MLDVAVEGWCVALGGGGRGENDDGGSGIGRDRFRPCYW